MNKEPQVALIMGSKSDSAKVQSVIDTLGSFKMPHTVQIFSAHRTPDELKEFVMNTHADVFICAAGMSAALAGVVASLTTKPVIGLPLSGSEPNTMASMLSTLQMPPGIPVMTVGVDAGKNAALAAIRILSINTPEIQYLLKIFMEDQTNKVLRDNISVSDEIKKNDFTV